MSAIASFDFVRVKQLEGPDANTMSLLRSTMRKKPACPVHYGHIAGGKPVTLHRFWRFLPRHSNSLA